ncbi:hypothetical protein LTR36_009754 [Oleoguttula mirabilis]|uniref:Uncharacterized protein n=1 Tax=Oleoguttula mirabilis TaxID=1507867 RepID=A0AAV9J5D6_9PEZI|nr:hypothetical protein LTR36_009754 [Oleoguttula mirabilis]
MLICPQDSTLELPADCVRVLKLSSTLSIEGEIRAWSIWRGYFFAMINQYSIDDFIFVSTLLAFAWSLYVPELHGSYPFVSSTGFVAEVDFTGKGFLGVGSKRNHVNAATYAADDKKR